MLCKHKKKIYISDSESQSQDVPSNVMRKRNTKIRESSSESSEFSDSSDSFSDISNTESDDSSDEEDRLEMNAEEYRNEFLDAIDMEDLEKLAKYLFITNFFFLNLIYRKRCFDGN